MVPCVIFIALSSYTFTSLSLNGIEMRLRIASVVGIIIAPALAGCPYARDLCLVVDDHGNPHVHLPRNIASRSEAHLR